ncbi:hypothetical protein Q7P37_008346 [Cladosporium fusiforme]
MATKAQLAQPMTDFGSKEQPPAYDSIAPSSSLHIPRSIKASYQSSWSKLLCCGKANLNLKPGSFSTEGDSFKLSLPGGYSGSLILESAQGSKSPLARGIPGDRRSYEILFPGSMNAEALRRKPRKSVWYFAFPGAREGEVETFEWRRSRGSEVKQLGAKWRGWKLVRMRNNGSAQQEPAETVVDDKSLSDESDYEKEKGQEQDSASEDVVAVWARMGCLTSLHDVGELLFLNSGASGELGNRWAVMALMSAFCIWQKQMRDETTMATASAVTSTTTVTAS